MKKISNISSTSIYKLLHHAYVSGRGRRVVKVSDRGLNCHEFEPSTTKDPPYRDFRAQEESDPVDDEADEDEDNDNNESNKGP
ncbi:hypothetical protein TNCV_2931551 [Trichonephila clavipes]|nr:hypothetical protein TNCV_2931551 [Trichonephila clavipes]